MASRSVVQKIGNAFTRICVGIAQGVRPLVEYNHNARNLPRSRAIAKGSFVIMCSYTAICLLLSISIPRTLVGLFLAVDDTMSTAVTFLLRWLSGIVAVGILELLNAIFQAMGKWQVSMTNIALIRVLLTGTMFVIIPLFLLSIAAPDWCW